MDQTRKKEAQFSMARIEKHFTDLKEQLYKDRISQVEKKIEEVKKGNDSLIKFLNIIFLFKESTRLFFNLKTKEKLRSKVKLFTVC